MSYQDGDGGGSGWRNLKEAELIVFYTIATVMVVFLHYLFYIGWKMSPAHEYLSHSENTFGDWMTTNIKIHDRYEAVAFEACQATWFCVQLAYLGRDNLHSMLAINTLVICYALLAYSSVRKYAGCLSVICGLQLACTLELLCRLIVPPPVTDWFNVVALTLCCLLQIPATVINRIDTRELDVYTIGMRFDRSSTVY